MTRIVVIAEKPSMGRDIADALAHMGSLQVQGDGLCQHVGQYTVVGAQGHLFALASPEEYGQCYQFPWRIEPLPVLPQRFILEPNFPKEKGKVVNCSLTQSIRARLAKIKALLASADSVVHAGDPDREGQLIVDDILRQFGYRGPVKRLWLHAQTRDGIREAWGKMKDNSAYANLGLAAVARRESDWVIGMNATRAYSALWWKKGHKGLLNIGRVVTPLVGMIVRREEEIDQFVPIDHYTLKARIQVGTRPPFMASWIKPDGEPGLPPFDTSGKLIVNSAFVQAIQARCADQPAQIVVADTVPKKEATPRLHSLVELQKMAAKMGYAPDEVLAAAQALYEKHKLLSYPRTECQYAPESEHAKASSVIRCITNNFGGAWEIAPGWDAQRKSDAWDDKKLGEHFAIIPLPSTCTVSSLSQIERDVYRLVCRQYLAQFFCAFEYQATTVIAAVADQQFKATGQIAAHEGWRMLFGGAQAFKNKAPDADSDEQDNLPPVQLGQIGKAAPVELQAKATRPPARFTSITLLEAMEKAYLFVTDPKVKAKLKQIEGLGRAATRASIIACAVSASLVVEDRSGKVISYFPSPKALGYIRCVSETLTKPDLTAWFEGKLESMARGELDYADYQKTLACLVEHVIAAAKNGSALDLMPTPQEMPKAPTAKRSRKPSAARQHRSGRPKSSRNKAGSP